MSPRPAASAAVTAAGGKVFVTATMRTPAGSRPARPAAWAISARTAATRVATVSSGKEPGLGEGATDLGERQPDHVGERAVDALDQPGAEALNGVGPGLVVGLAGRHVGGDRARVERTEADARQDD